MESAQGLNYGTTLKCHFYDLDLFTYIIDNSLPGIELQWVGKIPINSIQGLWEVIA